MCKSQGKSANDSKKWDQAIEDAKDTISKCERKIESMKVAIKVFQQSRDEGAAYPGAQSSGRISEQQHIA
jgi:hypothetical protein